MRVTDEEAARIDEAARRSGFGTEYKAGAASYAKAVVLGHNPPSVFDKQVFVKVCELHGQLGKLGGLLKQAISEQAGSHEIQRHSQAIVALQAEVKNVLRELRDKV